MKKILLLGGSAQQIIAIETAKKLGYYTVLCDFLEDNPGQYVADKFYLVSTTDKQAVLDVAKKENISGVLAYASDPAAPTAAYIAENMDLPGNPYDSVEVLCNKDKFRYFLKKNNFNVPLAKGYLEIAEAINDLKNNIFKYPIIIKPVDSSGSKGVTVLNINDNFEEALKFAFSFSRSKKIIIEEYVQKKHKYLVGGDIFVLDGEIKLWGLLNCHRDDRVNSLVPVGKSFPVALENESLQKIKLELQRLVDVLNIKNGAMNVELVVDSNNKVYFIDIGPRSGGNMIPELIGMIFDVNVVEMSIKVAMGENINICINEPNNLYYATHNLHSKKNGSYKEIIFDNKIEKYIIRKNLYKRLGDKVFYFDNASRALGIIFMNFNTQKDMEEILENINLYYDVKLT